MPAGRLHTEFEGNAAQYQEDQHGGDGQIQRRQDDSVCLGKCDEQDAHAQHQPGFVGIPERTDRGHHDVLLLARRQWKQNADAEIEAVKDDVGQDSQAHQHHEDQREIELHDRSPQVASSGLTAADEVSGPVSSCASLSASCVTTTMKETMQSGVDERVGRQRQRNRTGRHGRCGLGRLHDALDQPGLTADLSHEPTGQYGDPSGKRHPRETEHVPPRHGRRAASCTRRRTRTLRASARRHQP